MHASTIRRLRAVLGLVLLLALALWAAPSALALSGSISGHVGDAGRPLGGITVSALDAQGRVVTSTVSSGDGAYLLQPLEAGSYRIEFQVGTEQYVPAYFDGVTKLDQATTITLDDAHPALVADDDIAILALPYVPAAAPDGGPAAAQKISLRGTCVSVSGDTLVIGAKEDTWGTASEAGAVYIYRLSAAGWAFERRLYAPTPAGLGYFGSSVAIDGDTLLVGGRSLMGTDRSRVWAYERIAGRWTLQQRLVPAGTVASRQGFGVSLAVSGDRALVGAPAATISKRSKAGAVYAFTRQGGAWVRAGRLTSPQLNKGDAFGSAVSVSGSAALVGAPLDDAAAGVDSGMVYAYSYRSGHWLATQQLKASPKRARAQFGTAIAIDAGTAVIAAPKYGSGAAFLFGHGSKGWLKQGRLSPADTATSGFGASIAVGHDTVLVGAPKTGAAFLGSKHPGAVYQFARVAGVWQAEDALGFGEMEGQSAVGSGVAVQGRQLVVLSEWDTRRLDESFYGVRIYDPYVTQEGTALEVAAPDGVLMNDVAPGGVLGIARLDMPPAHGTLDLREDGSFTYTPAPGFVGTDSFRYDDRVPYAWSSASTRVTITVH